MVLSGDGWARGSVFECGRCHQGVAENTRSKDGATTQCSRSKDGARCTRRKDGATTQCNRSKDGATTQCTRSKDGATTQCTRRKDGATIQYTHHHIVSATVLIHRTARPSISAMSSLLGISPKCVQLVMIWFRSHVAAPHIQCLFSR